MFLLALQPLPAPPPAGLPAPGVIASDFDLASHRAAADSGDDCNRGGEGAIVVCGQRPLGGNYPLEEMARVFETGPPSAEMELGGGLAARAFVEREEIGPGLVSNRVMFGIKLPF